MAEGYCVKCKAKKEIANGVEETMKNGRKAIKGKCPTCGTVMFKILGGKAAAIADTGQSADTPLIMPQQLAYVIITPYSLYKSRTGGILSRLITRTGLDLAAMRMFATGDELVKAICRIHRFRSRPAGPADPGTPSAICPAKLFARSQNRTAAAGNDASVSR